jgi:hypothetical protein
LPDILKVLIATLIAFNNKKVTHFGTIWCKPICRIDQNIRNYRKEAKGKEITWEQADKKMEEIFKIYKDSYNKELKEEPRFTGLNLFQDL